MRDVRTVYDLTEEEIRELKMFMLYDDENEFYEDIDEISLGDVIRRFGDKVFPAGERPAA